MAKTEAGNEATEATEAMPETGTPTRPSRSELRQAILGNPGTSRGRSKTVEFFGQTVELHQPTMEFIMTMNSEQNRARAAAQMIVGYTYAPGTSERVFEDEDIDAIMQMPFGADMNRINRAIAELTNLDVETAEGNSARTEPTTS